VVGQGNSLLKMLIARIRELIVRICCYPAKHLAAHLIVDASGDDAEEKHDTLRLPTTFLEVLNVLMDVRRCCTPLQDDGIRCSRGGGSSSRCSVRDTSPPLSEGRSDVLVDSSSSSTTTTTTTTTTTSTSSSSPLEVFSGRLEQVNRQIEMLGREGSPSVEYDQYAPPRDDLVWSAVDRYSEVFISSMKAFDDRCCGWRETSHALSSKHFLVSLRLVLKRLYVPDKLWLKLSYLFMRLYDCLTKDDEAASKEEGTLPQALQPLRSPPPSASSSSSSIIIDMQSWRRFTAVLKDAVHSPSRFHRFVRTLTSPADDFFSPTDGRDRAVFIRDDEWTELMELWGSSSSSSSSSNNITSYVTIMPANSSDSPGMNEQQSSGRQQQVLGHPRVASVYKTLDAWVGLVLKDLSSLSMKHGLGATVLPLRKDCTSQSVITVGVYWRYWRLLLERNSLETLVLAAERKRLRVRVVDKGGEVSSSSHDDDDVFNALFEAPTQQSMAYTSVHQSLSYSWTAFRADLWVNGLNHHHQHSNNSNRLLHIQQTASSSSSSQHRSSKAEVERLKQSQHRCLESLLCTMIEHSCNGLGCMDNSSALSRWMLPLCSLGMWSAVRLLIDKLRERALKIPVHPDDSKLNVNYITVVQSDEMVYRVTTDYDAHLCQRMVIGWGMEIEGRSRELYEASCRNKLEMASVDSTYIVTPLHYLISHDRRELLRTYLEAFPSSVYDLKAVLRYAELMNAPSCSEVILVHCMQSAHIARSIDTTLDHQPRSSRRFFTDHHHHQVHDARALSMSTFFRRTNQAIYHLLDDIRRAEMLHASTSANAYKQPTINHRSVFYLHPFVCTWESMSKRQLHSKQQQSTCLCVLLMDGSIVPWNSFIMSPSYMARALPAPLEATGISSTGHTLLHQACASGDEDTALYLLRLAERFNVQWGCGSGMSINGEGKTAFWYASSRNQHRVCRMMLERLLLLQRDDTTIGADVISAAAGDGDDDGGGGLRDPQLSIQRIIYQQSVSRPSSYEHALQMKQVLLEPLTTKLSDLRVHDICVPSIAVEGRWSGYCLKQRPTTTTTTTTMDLTDRLLLYLKQAEECWNYLCSAPLSKLMHIYHPQQLLFELDSVMRAKQVLSLIGVPVSQFGIPRDHHLRHVGSGSGSSSSRPVGDCSSSSSRPLKDFAGLGPSKMRKLISWNTAHQLRSVLSGWYCQRTTSRPSSLDDSMFLFLASSIIPSPSRNWESVASI